MGVILTDLLTLISFSIIISGEAALLTGRVLLTGVGLSSILRPAGRGFLAMRLGAGGLVPGGPLMGVTGGFV